MSNNFRVRVKSEGKWSNILFRKHIQLKDKKSFDVLDKLFGFLLTEGVPVPRIVRTKDGKTTFQEGDSFYVMYEFIPGNHYRGTLKELKDIARQTALLHLALQETPFAREIAAKRQIVVPWTMEGWDAIFEAAKLKRGKMVDLVKESRDFILQEAEKIQKGFKNVRPTKMQPIHCDLHPQNTIFSKKERLIAFLDFEGVRMGEGCRDAANACHRFVRQFAVCQGGEWRKTVPQGLKIFMKEYTKVSPLKEVRLFPLYIQDEILRKIFQDVSRYCLENDQRQVEGGELEKKLTLLKEASILEEYYGKLRR